jgi:hypothetical protein
VHIEIELSPGDCAKFVAIPWILQPVPALQQLPLALLPPLCDMLRFPQKISQIAFKILFLPDTKKSTIKFYLCHLKILAMNCAVRDSVS